MKNPFPGTVTLIANETHCSTCSRFIRENSSRCFPSLNDESFIREHLKEDNWQTYQRRPDYRVAHAGRYSCTLCSQKTSSHRASRLKCRDQVSFESRGRDSASPRI